MNIYQKIQTLKATIGAISKDQTNPFYKSKYFDINNLLEQLEPICQDVGILILQPLSDGCVCTKVIDIDTETVVESCIELPKFDDPQKMGSAITYYRRYSLQSLLSLQAEDDDANKASTPPKQSNTPKVSVWLSEAQFESTKGATKKQITTVLNTYDGTKGKGMKKEYREALLKLVK